MKIGFYGCANNYPFALARAFRRFGHEVKFIVSSRERLNRPEHRYPDVTTPYPSWIIDASHRFRWHSLVPGLGRRAIWDELNTCEAVILNEEGPALAGYLRVPYAVLLTGSDLEVFADPHKAYTLKPQIFSQPKWIQRLVSRLLPTALIQRGLTDPQRVGLRRAHTVISTPSGFASETDRLLEELGITGRQRLELQFTDTEHTRYGPPPQNRAVRIFNAARFTWRSESGTGLTSLDLKGSDVMVRGLAQFTRRTGQRLDIHFVKKGRHLREIMALIEKEGLANQITWHEEMSQSEVSAMFRQADIVFDQLGGSMVAMAGLEAMATGRPLIANGRPELIEPFVGEPSPICQARTTEDVCAQLERLVPSTEERIRVGLASRRYVEKYFSADVAARRLEKILIAHSKGTPQG